MEVGYWGIRGLINPVRLLLEHVGEKYDFKNWNTAQPGWTDQKFKLGMKFPNLPYIVDGNVKLSQSGAIIRYLARKHKLVATTEEEMQKQDLVDGVMGDMRMFWSKLCYNTNDFETDKVAYRKEQLAPILKEFDQWLSENAYVVGSKLTYSDFILFEILEGNTKMFPDLLKDYPHLNKYHQTIGNLKGVKEYLASDRMPTTFNGPMAKWGG